MYLFGQFNLHIISNKKKVSQARKDRAITNNENFERVSFSSKDRKYSTKIFLIEMIIVLFISHDQLCKYSIENELYDFLSVYFNFLLEKTTD